MDPYQNLLDLKVDSAALSNQDRLLLVGKSKPRSVRVKLQREEQWHKREQTN